MYPPMRRNIEEASFCMKRPMWLSEGAFDPKDYVKCIFCRPSVITEETVTLCEVVVAVKDLWYKFYTTGVILFFLLA